jgi:hypothetical protein
MNILQEIAQTFNANPALWIKEALGYLTTVSDAWPFNTWPTVPTNVLLDQGEVAIYSAQSTLHETRAVRYHVGGFVGFRVAKGIYIGGSSGRSLSEQEWDAIDDGQMTITTRRVVFDGTKQDRQVPLENIVAVDWTIKGVELTVDGRQKSMVISTDNPVLAAAIIIAAAQDKANWDNPGPTNPTKHALLLNAVSALTGASTLNTQPRRQTSQSLPRTQTKGQNTMQRTIAAILLTVGIALAGIGMVPESHAEYGGYRIGAICNDGTQSNATGSGACSWHSGVMCWLYSDGTCKTA